MIHRTLNIPVVAATVLGIAAAAGGFYAVRQWQLSRLCQTFLDRAQRAKESDDWLAAADQLDRYLRFRPGQTGIRTDLALTFAKGAESVDQKHRATSLHYRALATADADSELELRAGLSELLLQTGRLLEAELEAEEVLRREPQQPRASRVKALALYLQWRRGELHFKSPQELHLLREVESALELNPTDLALAEVAAAIYREHPALVRLDQPGLLAANYAQAAEGFLDRAVERSPNKAEAHLARYQHRKKYALAGHQEDLEAAVALAPDHPQILLVASEAWYARAREAHAQQDGAAVLAIDKSRQLLKRLVERRLAIDNPQPLLRLGDLCVLEGNLDEAIEYWQQGAKAFSKPTYRAAFHARVADHLLRAGRAAEEQTKTALEAVQEILDTLGGTIRREDHLALLQAQGLRQATFELYRGHYAAAIAELERAISRQPQLQPDPRTAHAAWDLLGRAHSGLQDWSAAATAFDRASNFLHEDSASRVAAAEAWLSAGRLELAQERAELVIQQAQQQNNRALSGLPLAWLVLASAELHEQQTRRPESRNWQRLELALAELHAYAAAGALAAPWRVDFLQADILALQTADETDERQRKAAADVLRHAEDKYANRPEFWFQACLAYERLGQSDDADRALQHLNQLPDGQADAVIVASRRAAAKQDYTQATSVLQAAAPGLPLAAQERIRQELLRIAQLRQDLPQMKSLFLAMLRDRPRDAAALCGLAELALRAGDFTALAKWVHELAAAGPPGDVWAQYFHIARLVASATGPSDPQLNEALAAQSRLQTLRPNWAEGYALRGTIEQRREQYESAVTAYEQALQLGERRFIVYEQLIGCLDRLQRTDEVDQYLTQLQRELPASQRLTELAAARQLAGDRPEQAITIARQAVERRPADGAAQLWLARLHVVAGDLPQAEAAFEQAAQLAPEDGRVWEALFGHYLRVGDRDRAVAALHSLEKHAQLSAAQRDFVLGRCWAQLGETVRALELLQQTIEREPDSIPARLQYAELLLETDREQAKRFLRDLLQRDPKSDQARWLLAAALAADGSEEDLAAAEELLGQSSPGVGVADRRARALLLAQHGGDHGLAQAIASLEKLIENDSISANDRLLLAQLLERRATNSTDPAQARHWLAAARGQLEAYVGRPQSSPADLGLLVSFLWRHDQKAAAAEWLDKLEARLQAQARPQPRAIALLIDLLLTQGSPRRCEPWLDQLEALDRDPLRPLIARVKYFAALPKLESIEPTIELQAEKLLAAARSFPERNKLARQFGDLYLIVNQLAGAERWYRVVIEADPTQFQPLAVALARQGRGLEAIRLCQTAAESDATSRPAVVLTSLLLEMRGQRELMQVAEPLLAAALEKFPSDVALLYGVGMLRVLENRYPEAMELLQRVVSLQPHHVAALNNLAMLLAESEETRSAGMALVERAIAHRGHQPTLLDTKGTILLWDGRTQEAVKLLEAAARGSSADPRHNFHLASAYLELGEAESAHSRLQDALDGNLEQQILTPTDRQRLTRLRQVLVTAPESSSDQMR